jgi:threonine/homoserine/homoserine lactone efflux protein
MMAITAVAGVPAESVFHRLLRLAPVFVVLPLVCLLLWASLGVAIQHALREATARAWFDRILGAVLVASAVLLLSEI